MNLPFPRSDLYLMQVRALLTVKRISLPPLHSSIDKKGGSHCLRTATIFS